MRVPGDEHRVEAGVAEMRLPVPGHRHGDSLALGWHGRRRMVPARSQDLVAGWTLAITTGDDVHIGCVGIELMHGQWHLGYWLNRYYWNRGYASEAAHAAMERFFRRMPGTVLHSGVFADNAGSLKLQKKLGFEITGCSQIYALARNGMVSHIETSITAAALRAP
jgi:RimJ/RimL family protein N-acetyltransferase